MKKELVWGCGANTCTTTCSWINKRQRLLHPTARQLDSLPLPPGCTYWLRLYQSPYWSQMKQWTHQYLLNASLLFNHLPFKSQARSPTWCICFLLHKFALSFREERAIIINISPCALCQACGGGLSLKPPATFYLGLKRAAFLFPPVLTTSYSYILNELPWMSQMKSKCKPID